MFINILPPAIQKEVREWPGLHSLQQCINHVLSDIGRLIYAKLSNLHSDRLKQSLSTYQRVSPLIDRAEDEAVREPAPEDPFKSLINVLSDKMDYIAAAIGKPDSRITEPPHAL